jgi:hypothetical protein
MRHLRTTAVGTWLLERAGVDDALAGDLAEHTTAGGSPVWYWRQVVSSIASTWIGTIRTHKLLTLRAVITGWTIWAVLFLLRDLLQAQSLQAQWTPTLIAIIRYSNWIVIGWAIGVLHRPYHGAMVLAYMAFLIVMSVPGVSRAVSIVGHPSYNAPSFAMVVFAVISLTVGALLSDASLTRSGR